VNIKVDREERPDVDRVYMMFVQAATGSGGWPMSVWLTPELKRKRAWVERGYPFYRLSALMAFPCQPSSEQPIFPRKTRWDGRDSSRFSSISRKGRAHTTCRILQELSAIDESLPQRLTLSFVSARWHSHRDALIRAGTQVIDSLNSLTHVSSRCYLPNPHSPSTIIQPVSCFLKIPHDPGQTG
jgi:hypothetical protein